MGVQEEGDYYVGDWGMVGVGVVGVGVGVEALADWVVAVDLEDYSGGLLA